MGKSDTAAVALPHTGPGCPAAAGLGLASSDGSVQVVDPWVGGSTYGLPRDAEPDVLYSARDYARWPGPGRP